MVGGNSSNIKCDTSMVFKVLYPSFYLSSPLSRLAASFSQYVFYRIFFVTI